RARIVAEEKVDEILLLLNAAFEIRDLFACGVNKLFALPDIEERCIAMVGQNGDETQRFASGGQRITRDFELEVQGAELEVGGSNVRDKREDNRATAPLGGEEGSTSGLSRASIATPKVKLPGPGDAELTGTLLQWRENRRFCRTGGAERSVAAE